MSSICLRCDFRAFTNEVKALGNEVYLNQDFVGVHVFVIPQGEQPDVWVHADGCFGPQRKVWYWEIPEECTCGDEISLHYTLIWDPGPEPAREPLHQEVAEFLSLL